MKLIIKTVAALALLLSLGGCVVGRSVMDLKETTPAAATPAAALPASAPAVKFAAATDARVFEIDPKTPDHPSLKDDDIHNPAVTARAVARKRNGYGMAMGDVLLPEGDSVSAHVTDALKAGFQQGGYRVLGAGDAGADQAAPVTATIKEYWCWDAPGFVEAKMSCKATIELTSDLAPLKPSQTIATVKTEGVQIGLESYWRELNHQVLQDITAQLAKLLAK